MLLDDLQTREHRCSLHRHTNVCVRLRGGLGHARPRWHQAQASNLRNIMPVGPGHDERQRDATTVHQQMALAPIFFPDPLDSVPRFPDASGAFIIAPSMLCHRQAMPSNSSYSARPNFHKRFKDSGFLPLQKAGMNRTGATVTFSGKRLPLAAGSQNETRYLQIPRRGSLGLRPPPLFRV
jgi:hypothetical protein